MKINQTKRLKAIYYENDKKLNKEIEKDTYAKNEKTSLFMDWNNQHS